MESEFSVDIYKSGDGCYRDEKLSKLSFFNKEVIPIDDIIGCSAIPLMDKFHFLMEYGKLTESEANELHGKAMEICSKIYWEINDNNMLGDIVNIFVEISKLKYGSVTYMNKLQDHLFTFVRDHKK